MTNQEFKNGINSEMRQDGLTKNAVVKIMEDDTV